MEGKTDVLFLHVIPKYSDFFKPCFIKKFENLHQEEKTQLQWRFRAVAVDDYFPLGVQTTYSAAPFDKGFEILQMSKDVCRTKLGQLTGLEPVPTFFEQWPKPGTYHDRPVAGMHLLTHMPSGVLKAMNIKKNAAEAVRLAIHYVRQRYRDTDSLVVLWWEDWQKNHSISSNDVDEYLRHHSLEVPLRDFFEFDDHVGGILTEPPSAVRQNEPPNFNSDVFKVMALATPSVHTSFLGPGLCAPDYRLIFYNEEFMRDAMTEFEQLTVPSFASFIASLNKSQSLKVTDRLSSLQNRSIVARAATVVALKLECLKVLRVFVDAQHQRDHIRDVDVHSIMSKYGNMVNQKRNEVIVNVSASFQPPISKVLAITNADIAALAPDMPLTDDIMDKLMHLGNARETHLLRSASNARPQREYMRSLWLPSSFLPLVQEERLVDAVALCHGISMRDCHFIFIPFRDMRHQDDTRDNHAGIVIDPHCLKAFVVVPSYSSANHIESDALLVRMPLLIDLVNKVFAHQATAQQIPLVIPVNAVTLIHGEGPYNSYASIEDGCNSGVMLLTLFDYIFHMCPMHIRRRQLDHARKRLAVALYLGRFPKDI